LIFAETWFISFFLGAILAVWFLPKHLRRLALLIACFIFHARYAGQAGMIPILVLSALVYFALGATKPWRIAAIAISVLSLVYYKYTGFINDTIGTSIKTAAAPLAISFFVFEFVHLLIERGKNNIDKPKSIIDYLTFIIFFPSLASGPIKRWQLFQPELERLGRPSWPLISHSLFRITLGAYKKFGIADTIAQEIPGSLSSWNGSISGLCLLLGIRIFMDFSGYSDIAIGLAGMFNIRIPENFSFPYLATNISDFWRRWHISLSTWIRDYVYIVLGGGRVSMMRKAANLLVAMILCGFWHGPAFHFALWGLMQGLALAALHFWRKLIPWRMPALVAWAGTFTFVQLSWLVFFYKIDEIILLFNTARII